MVYVRIRDHMFRLSSIVLDITEGVAESKKESLPLLPGLNVLGIA